MPAGKDEASYSILAARLAIRHGYSFPVSWYPFAPADAPTSHWSFLYTAFVAAVFALAGPHPLAARFVQAVVAGLLMPWLMYRLTQRLRVEGSRAQVLPLLAAFLAAIYAYFVLYGAMVQTEAFFICAVLWSLERGMAMAEGLRNGQPIKLQLSATFGLSLGVATLLRQSILPWVAVMFGYLLWVGWRGTPAGTRPAPAWVMGGLFVAGGVLLACIAPFTIRNYCVYDDFLLLNSNVGYAMYSAQHPIHGTSFQEYAAAPLPAELVDQGLNEAQWDRELMRRGMGFVLAEPGRYLLLSLSRVRDYFEFWPTPDSSLALQPGRVLSIGIFLPFMICGIYLTFRPKCIRVDRQPAIFLLVFMVFYSLLHIFTWAMSRYRLPVDAVALPFAALVIAELMERMKWTKNTDEY